MAIQVGEILKELKQYNNHELVVVVVENGVVSFVPVAEYQSEKKSNAANQIHRR